MSKKFKLLVALLALFGLIAASCGDDDDDTTTTDDAAATDGAATDEGDTGGEAPASDVSVGLVYDIGGRGDLSFNDSAFAGVERAAAELGITFTEASPNADGSNRLELLDQAAASNDIVIAVGFLFEADAAASGAANPGVNYGVIDSSMLDFSQDPAVPYGDNIAGLVFAEEQGSFLVGAAAALMSETGHIGYIGGVAGLGGLLEKFEAGYRAGALAVNPDIIVDVTYITEAPNTDGFNAPDQAKEIALSMYEGGADIIYAAAGLSGTGMFEAAAEYSESSGSKVWGIGVDSDQYNTVDPSLQEYVLTSMLKRVDNAIFEAISAHIDGTFVGGPNAYDLSVDGVGYSTSGDFLPQDVIDQLEDFKAQIVAGDIVVPTDPAELG